MKTNKLRLTKHNYDELKLHLFPGDDNEAIAFALCGYCQTEEEEIFTVNQLFLYPHEKCTVRTPDRVEWSPPEIVDLFEICRKENLRLLKIHCHPGYWPHFSHVDELSDSQLCETLTGWTDRNDSVISVIMLPDGHLFGRTLSCDSVPSSLDSIIVVGDNITVFQPFDQVNNDINSDLQSGIQLRTSQAFGDGTVNVLRKLKIGVVGCSGTGSIVAELLGRLGVGNLVLVDHDIVEFKNLNRILNTTKKDAENKASKVSVLKSSIEAIGTGTKVLAISKDLHEHEAYLQTSSCDIVFGCMDTIDGRHLLNRISSYFCSAYFDIGVRLDANGVGGINEILGRVDYLQPGKSSLFTRGRYTLKQLQSSDLERTNPNEYKRQLAEKYIKAANVESPAVISINMMFSSQAVTELLARLHPFKDQPNSYYSSIIYSVSGFLLLSEKEGEIDYELRSKVGRGSVEPILGSPMLISKL